MAQAAQQAHASRGGASAAAGATPPPSLPQLPFMPPGMFPFLPQFPLVMPQPPAGQPPLLQPPAPPQSPAPGGSEN
ncbi:hypothetical protein CHLRE_02g078251v5 [Chlamydomonas reinhardtii]|nr:uncharacterized protein CHLRE_02g078251v5 [Chlamydomonas reinhardtii]PNW86236.1 hypothetical protein CHLRE_02g078251v5 [Chlamydomonas reinhardtii]